MFDPLLPTYRPSFSSTGRFTTIPFHGHTNNSSPSWSARWSTSSLGFDEPEVSSTSFSRNLTNAR
ncbi:hypothetical protein HanRHA438_Chr07g0319831 [Helianthus annuus]|nr:hypothetical protein HanRHA438_Chr07g0319831 [Helianthus annuus]